MENTSAPDSVLLTASGMAVHVPFTQTTPEQDRLRISWCLLGAAAMNMRVDKPIEVPDRYFAWGASIGCVDSRKAAAAARLGKERRTRFPSSRISAIQVPARLLFWYTLPEPRGARR